MVKGAAEEAAASMMLARLDSRYEAEAIPVPAAPTASGIPYVPPSQPGGRGSLREMTAESYMRSVAQCCDELATHAETFAVRMRTLARLMGSHGAWTREDDTAWVFNAGLPVGVPAVFDATASMVDGRGQTTVAANWSQYVGWDPNTTVNNGDSMTFWIPAFQSPADGSPVSVDDVKLTWGRSDVSTNNGWWSVRASIVWSAIGYSSGTPTEDPQYDWAILAARGGSADSYDQWTISSGMLGVATPTAGRFMWVKVIALMSPNDLGATMDFGHILTLADVLFTVIPVAPPAPIPPSLDFVTVQEIAGVLDMLPTATVPVSMLLAVFTNPGEALLSGLVISAAAIVQGTGTPGTLLSPITAVIRVGAVLLGSRVIATAFLNSLGAVVNVGNRAFAAATGDNMWLQLSTSAKPDVPVNVATSGVIVPSSSLSAAQLVEVVGQPVWVTTTGIAPPPQSETVRRAQEQSAHNRLMHALCGNTSVAGRAGADPLDGLPARQAVDALIDALETAGWGVRYWWVLAMDEDPDTVTVPEAAEAKIADDLAQAVSRAPKIEGKVDRNRVPLGERGPKQMTTAAKHEPHPRDNVVERLVRAIPNAEAFVAWYKSAAPRLDFAKRVWEKSGLGEPAGSLFSALWEAIVQRRNRLAMLAGLAAHWTPLRRVMARYDWVEVYKAYLAPDIVVTRSQLNGAQGEVTGKDDVDAPGWSEQQARSRNKRMHAAHGNTSKAQTPEISGGSGGVAPTSALSLTLASTMEEIGERSGMDALFDAESAQTAINPAAEQSSISGVYSVASANTAQNPGADFLRLATISSANIQTPVVVSSPPECLLLPRLVRNTGQVVPADDMQRPLVNAAARAKVYTFGAQWPPADKVALTAHGLDLKAASAANGGIRPGTLTLNGLRPDDEWTLSSLAEKPAPVSGSSWLRRGCRLAQLAAWCALGSAPNMLPLSGQVGKFDFSVVESPAQSVVGWNDSPVFGENCGGADPVFPYAALATSPAGMPAGKGVLRFHQCLATVPVGRRSDVLVLRASDLLATDTGTIGVNIFLKVFEVAEKAGLGTLSVVTTDMVGVNPGVQPCLPFSELLHFGGDTVVDVLLPMMNAKVIPTAQGEANSGLVVAPATGPTASIQLAPNQLLNVCYVGALGTSEYPLADYIYTWLAGASPIDATTLNRYMVMRAEQLGRTADLAAAVELVATMSARYRPPRSGLTALDAGSLCVASGFAGPAAPVNPSAFESSATDAVCFNAYRPIALPADLPLATPPGQPQWVLPEMSNIVDAWHVLDLARSPARSCSDNLTWFFAPQATFWSPMVARDYCWAMFAFYRTSNLTAAMVSNFSSNSPLVSLRNQLRGLVVQTPEGGVRAGVPLHAPLAQTLADLHASVNRSRPTVDGLGIVPLYGYVATPQGGGYGLGGLAPVAGFEKWGLVLGALTCAERTEVVPQLLPDVWVWATRSKIPLALQPVPAPQMRARGVKAPGAVVIPWAGGNLSVPVLAKRAARSLGQYAIPQMSDAELFNARLVYAEAASWALYTTDGLPYAADVLPVYPAPDWGNMAGHSVDTFRGAVAATVGDPGSATVNQTPMCGATVQLGHSFWIPPSDSTGLNLIAGVGAVDAVRVAQYLAGAAFASVGGPVLGPRTIQPVILLGGDVEENVRLKPKPVRVTGGQAVDVKLPGEQPAEPAGAV